MFSYERTKNALAPLTVLRIGLGLVFLYAGVYSVFAPREWLIYLPKFVLALESSETIIIAYGIFEIILGIVFLSGRMSRTTSFLAFLHFAGVLLLSGITNTTFRDFGLLTIAFFLFYSANQNTEREKLAGKSNHP